MKWIFEQIVSSVKRIPELGTLSLSLSETYRITFFLWAALLLLQFPIFMIGIIFFDQPLTINEIEYSQFDAAWRLPLAMLSFLIIASVFMTFIIFAFTLPRRLFEMLKKGEKNEKRI